MDDVEPSAYFDALMLAPSLTDPGNTLSDFTRTDSSFWRTVSPPWMGGRNSTKRIGVKDDSATATSSWVHPENPRFVYWEIRSAPAHDGDGVTWTQVDFNSAASDDKWSIIIPHAQLEAATGTLPKKTITLQRDGADYAHWSANEPQLENDDVQFKLLEFAFLDDSFFLQDMVNKQIWEVRDQGKKILCPSGTVKVTTHGGNMAFRFAQVKYASSGTARTRVFTRPETAVTVNPAPSYYVFKTGADAGKASIEAENSSDDATYKRPVITLSTDDTNVSPLLWRASQVHDVVFGTAVSSPVDITEKVQGVRITMTRDGRDARADISFLDDGTTSVFRNQKCTVQVGWALDDDTTPLTLQLTGHISQPTFAKQADAQGRRLVSFTAGAIERLRHKRAVAFPALAYFELDFIFQWMCNRWNIPNSLISVEASNPIRVGHPQERLLNFNAEDDAPMVLDKLAEALRLQWGVKPDGTVFIRSLSGVGSGASQFTLNATTATEDDYIRTVDMGFESEEDFANIVIATGRNERGFLEAATAVNTPSISTASASDFIGDDWWKAIHNDSIGDPVGRAEWELYKAGRRRMVVEWTSTTKLELMPDDVVTMDVANMGIVTGTKFVIYEKMLDWSVASTSVTYKGEILI